jgi:hypothetical protein
LLGGCCQPGLAGSGQPRVASEVGARGGEAWRTGSQLRGSRGGWCSLANWRHETASLAARRW